MGKMDILDFEDFEPYDNPSYYPQLTSGTHIVTIVELVIFAKKQPHLSRIIKTLEKLKERGAKRRKNFIITLDKTKTMCKLYTTDSFISRTEDDVF